MSASNLESHRSQETLPKSDNVKTDLKDALLQGGKDFLGREKFVSRLTQDFISMPQLENWNRRAEV